MVKEKKKAKGLLDKIDARKAAGGGLLIGAGVLVAMELGFLGKPEAGSEGGLQPMEALKGILTGAPAPPGEANYGETVIPAQASVIFPEPPTFDFSKFFRTDVPAREAGGVAGEGIPTPKKETTVRMFEGLPIPSHYPEDVVSYAQRQYRPEAFIRGLREEQANIAYLEQHPTLMLSKKGSIIQSAGRTRTGEKTASTFSTAAYQAGYQARQKTRYAAARAERNAARTGGASSSGGGSSRGGGYSSGTATAGRPSISKKPS